MHGTEYKLEHNSVYQEYVAGDHSLELYKSGVGSRGALLRVLFAIELLGPI